MCNKIIYLFTYVEQTFYDWLAKFYIDSYMFSIYDNNCCMFTLAMIGILTPS